MKNRKKTTEKHTLSKKREFQAQNLTTAERIAYCYCCYLRGNIVANLNMPNG